MTRSRPGKPARKGAKSRKTGSRKSVSRKAPVRKSGARKSSPRSRQAVFTCGTIRRVFAGRADLGWNTLSLTFTVGAPPAGIQPATFRTAVNQALDIWRRAVPFQFSEVPSGGTISITGVAPEHGDGFSFPPQTIELAHAFGPMTGAGTLDGQVHLNNAKRWADGPGADADVLTIVLHELGHALGIVDHFGDASTVMNGSFPAGLVRTTLTAADQSAMRALYAHLIP